MKTGRKAVEKKVTKNTITNEFPPFALLISKKKKKKKKKKKPGRAWTEINIPNIGIFISGAGHVQRTLN